MEYSVAAVGLWLQLAQAAAPLPTVVFTRERINSTQMLRLKHAAAAAAAVGVSPTAFKKACRRLGVARWAYRRQRTVTKGRIVAKI